MYSLRNIGHFKIHEAVPLDGSATYAEIAKTSGVPERFVFRFIRNAMINGIFKEPSRGRVAHTARSRWLVEHPGVHDAVSLQSDEISHAAVSYTKTIEKYGASEEPNHSPFAVAEGVEESVFQIFARHPERRQRFGRAMHYWTSFETWDLAHVLNGFDWASVDKPGAKAVDVGGGLGQVSAVLAQNTQNIHFEVQDLPPVVEDAKKNKDSVIPPAVASRVDHVAQSFLEPQVSSTPVDVVVLRWILHNWSDKYVVRILSNLLPVLKKGTRILIVEYVLDEDPVTLPSQMTGLRLDMIMGVICNAKERTEREYGELLSQASDKLKIKAARRPQSSVLSVIEAVYDE